MGINIIHILYSGKNYYIKALIDQNQRLISIGAFDDNHSIKENVTWKVNGMQHELTNEIKEKKKPG